MALTGVVYGVLVGFFDNWLLFWQMARNKKSGKDPLRGVGAVFLARYLLDVVFLIVFSLVTRNGIAITAAALSVTVAVKISLIIVYTRKGGRFD